MKANVSVAVIYPYGFYDQITIKVDTAHGKLPSSYFELLFMSCQSGSAIKLSLIHISEPTRPLYISYAVFCLKKS